MQQRDPSQPAVFPSPPGVTPSIRPVPATPYGELAHTSPPAPDYASHAPAPRDESSRAPAKVQSAVVEVMQEQQVTIGKETSLVPLPFLVLATQNPIETDGTYPLPEAQIDRFMFKVLVGYPSFPEEVVVVQRITGAPIELRQVVTVEQLREMQESAA